VKQRARELDGEVVRVLLGLSSEKANGKGGDGEVKTENGTTVCLSDHSMGLADGCTDPPSKTSKTKARESQTRTRASPLPFHKLKLTAPTDTLPARRKRNQRSREKSTRGRARAEG
jgi:hypothetical protein